MLLQFYEFLMIDQMETKNLKFFKSVFEVFSIISKFEWEEASAISSTYMNFGKELLKILHKQKLRKKVQKQNLGEDRSLKYQPTFE